MTATFDKPGNGVLAIWHDIDPLQEAGVIEWYNREHHFERVGTAGFRRARRYVSIFGAPKYFIYYETDTPEVMASGPYLERANAPSEWSRRSMPYFRNNHRTVCRVSWRSTGPDGGAVATLRIAPRNSPEETQKALQLFIESTVLPLPGLLKAQLWEADAGASAIPTGDKALRDHADAHSDQALILSGIDASSLNTAVTRHILPELARLGLGEGVETGLYLLQAAVDKESLTQIA